MGTVLPTKYFNKNIVSSRNRKNEYEKCNNENNEFEEVHRHIDEEAGISHVVPFYPEKGRKTTESVL